MINIDINDILPKGIEIEDGKGSLADAFKTVEKMEAKEKKSE